LFAARDALFGPILVAQSVAQSGELVRQVLEAAPAPRQIRRALGRPPARPNDEASARSITT
jgi:hypothetical protein